MHVSLENHDVSAWVREFLTEEPRNLQLSQRTLRGGLEAADVQHVRARYEDAHGRPRSFAFVRKIIEGDCLREADVYARVLSAHGQGLAPHLFGVTRLGTERAVLHLEAVSKSQAWPWRDTRIAEKTLASIARFHDADVAEHLPAWDYDGELQRMSHASLELLDSCRLDSDLRPLTAHYAPTKRMVLALPCVRRELASYSLGWGPIHGDLHPGNALVRGGTTKASEPVLLDWARARVGSPLEDVSSWLQSLGYWEPEVRRRHDRLLSAYLSARNVDSTLSSALRSAYWLAGVSNAFAGALYYHLSLARSAKVATKKAASVRAAGDWLRVVRRADAAFS